MGRMEFTRVSTKGQIVLPQSVRKDLKIKAGTILAVSETKKGFIVLKRIENPILREDLETLRKVEESWNDIEKGNYKKMHLKKFLKRIKKW